jgi:hypothetical protein
MRHSSRGPGTARRSSGAPVNPHERGESVQAVSSEGGMQPPSGLPGEQPPLNRPLPSSSPPPPTEPHAAPPPGDGGGHTVGSPHRWLVRTLIGLATVLGVVAIFAVWANRQLLDTGYWTTTSSAMLESAPIRGELAGYLTDQLYANVNVAGELRGELPEELKPLASPAAGALRSLVEKGVVFALERPRIQSAWRTANEIAHAQFVKLIENRGSLVRTPGGGNVVIDLRPLLGEVASRVGAPSSLVEKIPPNVAELRVIRSNNLKTAQNAVNALRGLAVVLPLLVYLLYALAVYLARGRRRQTLMQVGGAFIVGALVVFVVRSLAGHAVVNSLASTSSVKPAAEAAWSIGTSVLVEIAWATIYVGIALILAGLLAGPTHAATLIRHALAPYLNERTDIAFGVVLLLLLLLFVWGPIAATRTLTGVLIITALAVLGTYVLRRQTLREFPGATPVWPRR